MNFVFSFLLDNEEACDMSYDIIGLEYSGRIWKMISGHMYTT